MILVFLAFSLFIFRHLNSFTANNYQKEVHLTAHCVEDKTSYTTQPSLWLSVSQTHNRVHESWFFKNHHPPVEKKVLMMQAQYLVFATVYYHEHWDCLTNSLYDI